MVRYSVVWSREKSLRQQTEPVRGSNSRTHPVFSLYKFEPRSDYFVSNPYFSEKLTIPYVNSIWNRSRLDFWNLRIWYGLAR